MGAHRFCAVASIVLIGSTLAAADMTVEEARALAQPFVECDLATAEATTEVLGSDTFVTFRTTDPAMRVRVNATQGVFAGWVRLDAPSTVEGDLTEGEAIATASAIAARALGAAGDDLTWHASSLGEGYEVQGAGPDLGDPPRSGLTPSVRAHVLLDGTVLSYAQRLPRTEDVAPAGVHVSQERAVEIALGDVGLDGFSARQTDLSQRGGEARWTVEVTDAAGAPPDRAPRSVLYEIDAHTGEVLNRFASASSGWVERGYPPSWAGRPSPQEARAARRLRTYAALGAALLLAAGVGVVLLRRRR